MQAAALVGASIFLANTFPAVALIYEYLTNVQYGLFIVEAYLNLTCLFHEILHSIEVY